MSMLQDPKLLALLDTVIDHYIFKWDPIGSKFLHSLEDVRYAPSTLRKYLNLLEKAEFVYQPYNSSGRIPTTKWLSHYIDNHMQDEVLSDDSVAMDIDAIRTDVRHIVESLGNIVDGVVAGFVQHDEYYYLGINNLLREDMQWEYQTTKKIIEFIEQRWVVTLLDKKTMKRNTVYYTFIEDEETTISCLYTKVVVNDYDCILSIVGPARVNYKKNVAILKRVLQALQ